MGGEFFPKLEFQSIELVLVYFDLLQRELVGATRPFFIVKKIYPVYNPSVCTKLLLMQVLYRV